MISTTAAVQPQPPAVFPLDYPGNVWQCPITGITVPKDPLANTALRLRIAQCTDRRIQSAWNEAFQASPLLWINLMYWGYRPKYACEDGVQRSASTEYTYEGVRRMTPPANAPIITWPAQDAMIQSIWDVTRQGGIMLTDKSRDQGATVIAMGFTAWALLHWERFSAVIASRKEDLVDGNTEDSLFGKIDYALDKLPSWHFSRRRFTRTHMEASYSVSGARIKGESANDDIGQSLRAMLFIIDESARFPFQGRLRKSIDSVAAAQLHISTPDGPGTEFSKMRLQAETAQGRGRIRVFTLGYWDHPQHGRRRQWVIDEDGQITGAVGKGYWKTPALDVAVESATSMRDIRENWLIDHDTSGAKVLDINAISRQRANCNAVPQVGMLQVKGMFNAANVMVLSGAQIAEAPKVFVPQPKGRLRVWCPLVNGEPAKDRNYVQAWDFSQGVESSNTVCGVMDRETGEVVAEFASPSIAPDEAAAMAIALGSWFGGQIGWSFIIFEANGPGLGFGSTITRLGYPYLYYQRAEQTGAKAEGTRWGWWSTGSTKEILFTQLNRALRSGEITVRSNEMLDDMASWLFDDAGRIVSASCRDESTGAQARHGDRAIVAGLLVMARREAPRYQPTRTRYRPGTLGAIAHNFDDEPKPASGW